MNQNVLVSVIIPTHNRAELLDRAISSVLNQTYTNLEVIVVSDGSTDNTKSIVNKYSEKDDRVKFLEYFPSCNGNVARNKGIKMSRGSYVAFLDDDDEWFPKKIELQLNEMKKDDKIGLVYTGVHIIYTKENVEYKSIPTKKGNLSHDILFENIIGSTSSVMVRKDIFEIAGVFDETLGALQDYDLWIRICQCCKVGVVADEMLYYYNYPSSNQISSNTQKYVRAYDSIEKKYLNLYNTFTNAELRERKLQILVELANRCIRNGERKEARIFIKKALQQKICCTCILLYIASFLHFKSIIVIRSMIRKR